jgi:putative phosphoribosyl transferase
MSSATEAIVHIRADGVRLEGALSLPGETSPLVLFAHGTGSSRLSPRNSFVARELQNAGLGTLLLDLLTESEDEVYETRFDIALLTRRLIAACGWMEWTHPANAPLGLFGASTGAAAALNAAASLGARIRAVVSRGGRPDLATEALPRVRAATLLIVGGRDDVVLDLNQRAYARLECTRKLVIVPGATHLFEERGALDEVARLAAGWFTRHLAVPA